MYNRGRKELADDPRPEEAEQDLDDSRRDPHTKGQLIGLDVRRRVLAEGEAEILDATNGYHDQAGSRTLDRQLRIADKRCQDTTDDRSEDASDRRVAACQGNSQAEWQCDQEHQEP